MHTASVAARQAPCTLAVPELRSRRWSPSQAVRCVTRAWSARCWLPGPPRCRRLNSRRWPVSRWP